MAVAIAANSSRGEVTPPTPTQNTIQRNGSMKAVLVIRNAVVIAVAGTLFGLLANAVSPRGLSLTRDYFAALTPATGGRGSIRAAVHVNVGGVPSPRDHAQVANGTPVATTTTGREPAQTRTEPGEGTPPATAESRIPKAPGITKHGLPLATHDEVVSWFHEPAYQQQRIIFIDARNDDAYAAGHIPGAYPFDHYHPERHIANVLAVSQLAERIVVYCTGGDCEDSELATLDLIALGIPRSKLVIYGGGFTEWSEGHLPVQTGPTNSP